MPETDETCICVQIEKVISAEGYGQNFLPRLKDMIERTGEIRLLLYYKNFVGWEGDAAKLDMAAMIDFHGKLKKLAMVNAPHSETLRILPSNGEVRFFDESELARAVLWVKN